MDDGIMWILECGPGCRWVVAPAPEAYQVLSEFAEYLQLKAALSGEAVNLPHMLFLPGDGVSEPVVEKLGGLALELGLPKSGWRAHQFSSLRYWWHSSVPHIICEIGDKSSLEVDMKRKWAALYVVYLHSQEAKGFPVHAALVERNGQSVLLAGPSGAGKSTLCARLTQPWEVLDDEQALVVPDDNKGYRAIPLCIRSKGLGSGFKPVIELERRHPLRAIFFIEQAITDEVIPIGQGEAAVSLEIACSGTCNAIWLRLDLEAKVAMRKRIFDNASRLARSAPAYKLRVSLTGRVWELMEEVL